MLIVKAPRGLVVRDAPLSQAAGGLGMRTVKAGAALMCYDIHNIQGVDYARLVPQNPLKPEWVRVAEADHSIEYVDVIPLGQDAYGDGGELAAAITRLAISIELMAENFGNPMKESG